MNRKVERKKFEKSKKKDQESSELHLPTEEIKQEPQEKEC